ncbi:hypothetical protein [Staphylococcus phage LY01]|nr:hypothetical protein [Staphylococcus phage LY01]
MLGSKIRKSLNEKFGYNYIFLLEDFKKDYDLNKDTIMVTKDASDITKEYKIKTLKYTKDIKKLDKDFKKEEEELNIKKSKIFNLDELGLDEDLRNIYKYIDSTTKLKVKVRECKKESKENIEFFYKNFANFTYNSIIYDMSHFKPSTIRSNQKVICRKHGPFFTTPIDFFIKKKGCPVCEKETEEEKKDTSWKDKFIENKNEKIYQELKEEKEKENKKTKEKVDVNEENKRLLDEVLNPPKLKYYIEPDKIPNSEKENKKFLKNIKSLDKGKIEENKEAEKPKEIIKPKLNKKTVDQIIEDNNTNLSRKIKYINKNIYTENERQDFYKKLTDRKHGKNKYKIDKFRPKTIKEKQEVICLKHGPFKVTAEDLLIKGRQCPKCSSTSTSITETFVREYIQSLDFEVNNYEIEDLIKPYGIDIVIENLKLAIEVQGIKYHSSETRSEASNKYHQLRKLKMLENKGYHLLNIYDDEIPNKSKGIGWDKFGRFLSELMMFDKRFDIEDIDTNSIKIDTISYYKFREFFENSRQEFVTGDTEYKGVIYKNRLISVFSYNKETRKCHNYHTMTNNKFDLELINRKYKNLKFIVKRDSYVAYKMKSYDMLPIAETEPDFCNFSKNNGNRKNNYIRQKRKDENDKNKIYDCGNIIFVF